MSVDLLTADLGNSRCKLRLWRQRGPGPAELVAAATFARELAASDGLVWLASEGGARRGALASVAGEELTGHLRQALERELEDRLLVAPDPGLASDCSGVGVDRLYAARGAVELLGRSAVVVDAGTALTVDAVRRHGGEDRFLGGAIAPGPALLSQALARGGAQLFEVAPSPGARALGRETAEALAAGVAVGFRGAAAELIRRVSSEAGLTGAPLVLTGGARAFLVLPEPLDLGAEREVVVEEHLVHRGLLWAARRVFGDTDG